MNTGAYQISLSYNQILNLVKQLSFKEKTRLSMELAKETKDQTLTRLLNSFRTEEITQDEIDKEVESVRSEIYAKREKN
jgi:spore coat protein CotH